MAKSKAANTITIILAAMLSVMLVVMVAATPVYISLSALFSPERMVQIVNKVGHSLIEEEIQVGTGTGAVQDVSSDEPSEFGTVVEGYMDKLQEFVSCQALIDGALDEFELSKTSIFDLMDSKAVQEMLTVYAEDVCNFLITGEAEHNLTEAKVKEILTRNFDEIFEIAKQAKSYTVSVTDDMIKARLEVAIEENAKEISEAVLTVEEITSVVKGNVKTVIRILTNKMIMPIMIIACVLLAALLYVCRLKKFGGFLWLGIDVGIAAVILTAVYILLSATPGFIENSALYILISAAVSVYLEILMTGMLILFAIAIVILALFFILKYKVVKKREEAAIAE